MKGDNSWKVGPDRLVYRASIFDVCAHDVANTARGFHGEYYLIRSVDWVNVIAITPNDECVMIEQFRPARRESYLEFPGGMMGKDETSAELTARRELEEETGYRSDEVTLLGRMAPNPAIFNNVCHFYLATNATLSGNVALDPGEDLVTRLVPRSDLPKLVREGRIGHSLMLAGLSYLFAREL